MLETSETEIAIAGAGTMGRNIALDFLRHGYAVRLFDDSPAQLSGAEAHVLAGAELLERSGLGAPPTGWIERLTLHDRCSVAVAGANIVIEAIPENLDAKLRFFREMDSGCPAETILASNTSGFLPSILAEGLEHPERLLVAHYWNPAHLIPLVELVPHPGTRPEVVESMRCLLIRCGKSPVVLRREVPGFIGNRLAFALQREAMDLVQRGIADPDEIDVVVRAGFGRRMPVSGVFGTADLGGLDVYLAVCRNLFPDLCTDKDASEALVKLVGEGRLGTKTGAGWRDYSDAEAKALRTAMAEELVRQALRDRENSIQR